MGRGKSARLVIAALAVVLTLASAALAANGGISEAPSSADSTNFQLTLSGPPVCLDVSAYDTPTPLAAGAATSSAAVLLHRGLWDFDLTGTHMVSTRGKRDRFYSGSAGFGYFVADNVSINAAVVGYAVSQPDNGAFAAGLDLYARWYFLTLDRLSFYIDTGAGVFLADKAVPERGTHFNFTPRSGIGVAYRFDESVYFLFGARYWHLSNAGIHGPSQNPSFDSVQYYGSIMYTF